MNRKEKNKLNFRELQFCLNYINSGNIEKSALKAGYKNNAFKHGNLLMEKENIKKEIDSLYKRKMKNLLYKACRGYEKLAFGSITDAVKLIYSKNLNPKDIENLDLFNVSEIKIRDGSLEIKFFDRIRALEKLNQLDIIDQDQANSFFDAIEKSTAALNHSAEEI